MPLSPSDVTYINKLLDRHLKYLQSWPRFRYGLLAASGAIVAGGIWVAQFSASMTRQFFDVTAIATQPTGRASTIPVTYAALHISQQTSEMQSRMDTQILIILAGFAVFGLGFIVAGIHLAGSTLSKWNHHRRDAILITLLREKCAAELAPPAAPLNSEP
jgi:hypothetical protein